MPFVQLLLKTPSGARTTSCSAFSQSHFAMYGVPAGSADSSKSWSRISRSGSPSHQIMKFAGGMPVPINVPSAARSSPSREFHAPVAVTAQDSAPGCLGSMSPAAPRPMSRPAGIDHSISPVAASRNVPPRLPEDDMLSCTANSSSPGRDGSRSLRCSASPWPRPVLYSGVPSSSSVIDP